MPPRGQSIMRFSHVNIRCADVERTRDFFERALGMTVGERPPTSSRGYWLYSDGTPVVHLVQRAPEEAAHEGAGNIDHIAFDAADIRAARSTLTEAGIPFQESTAVADNRVRVFIESPDGVRIELAFADEG